jgi:hypothetical protein
VSPGSSAPGKNTFGTSYPNATIENDGMSRRAPSSQPMYQSGWANVDTVAAW